VYFLGLQLELIYTLKIGGGNDLKKYIDILCIREEQYILSKLGHRSNVARFSKCVVFKGGAMTVLEICKGCACLNIICTRIMHDRASNHMYMRV
jgi:hypothetical protein